MRKQRCNNTNLLWVSLWAIFLVFSEIPLLKAESTRSGEPVDLSREVSSFKKGLRDPLKEMVSIYLREAQTLRDLGRYEESISTLYKGLYLDPEDKDLLLLLAKNLLSLGEYRRCQSVLERLLARYPTDVEGWKYLYICLDHLGDVQAKLRVLRILSSLDEKNADVYRREILSLLEKTGNEQVIRALNQRKVERLKKGICRVLRKLLRSSDRSQRDRLIKKVFRDLEQVETVIREDSLPGDLGDDFVSSIKDALSFKGMGYEEISLERLKLVVDEKCN